LELRIRPDLDPPRRVAFGAMPNITINQESVSLIEQERVTFQRFVELAFPQCVTLMGIPRERRFISMLPASYVLKRREDGVGWDDPMVQVALWNLHDLGIAELSIEATPEDGAGDPQIRFDRAEATDMALGRDSSINFSTVKSGRAFIAALNNVVHRSFFLNGVEHEIGIQSRPEIEKIAELSHQGRRNEEGLLFAISRTLAKMVQQGMTVEDVEVKSGMELLANLGCIAISVVPNEDRIVFNGFSIMSAMSSGLLQGLSWDQLKKMKENVQMMINQIGARAETPIVQQSNRPVAKRRRRN
jgi:hypothetical protein